MPKKYELKKMIYRNTSCLNLEKYVGKAVEKDEMLYILDPERNVTGYLLCNIHLIMNHFTGDYPSPILKMI